MAGGGGAVWTIAASQAASAAIAAGTVASLTGAGANSQAAQSSALGDISTDTGTAYRPAQWANAATTSIVIVGSALASVQIGDGDVTGDTSNSNTMEADSFFVFDAVLLAEHDQAIQKTQHPVQNGANIADHAFIMPARLTLEVGMSDVMDCFFPGQWGSTNKGVIAFQQLVSWATARQVMNVNTRLRAYTSMLIVNINAPDSHETQFGLRARITFEEMFTGTIAQQQVSSDPQTTDQTNTGTKLVQSPDPALLQQHINQLETTVPDAGDISSNTTDDDDLEHTS